MFKFQEYGLKLDSYYYDENRKSIIIGVKIRNKRVTDKFLIHEILNNKDVLINLHPIDLCILGILADNSKNINKNNNRLTRILDGFSMVKISPYLEIVKRDFRNGEEAITLRLKHTNKTICITLNELYETKNLINALQYQDAIALGCAMAGTEDFTSDKIIHNENEYFLFSCIRNGLFICIVILSFLISNNVINFNFLGGITEFHSEILMLPILAIIQNLIVTNHEFKTASKMLISVMLSLIIFIMYFRFIIELPYSDKYINTIKFNNFYSSILTTRSPFLLSFLGACLINVYAISALKYKFNNLRGSNKGTISYFTFTGGFFLVSLVVCCTYNLNNYSLLHPCYCAVFIFFAAIINQNKLKIKIKTNIYINAKNLIDKFIS